VLAGKFGSAKSAAQKAVTHDALAKRCGKLMLLKFLAVGAIELFCLEGA
jgi:hypothetical protein